jgi:hypothetical protein
MSVETRRKNKESQYKKANLDDLGTSLDLEGKV